jgi:hypothetical protein
LTGERSDSWFEPLTGRQNGDPLGEPVALDQHCAAFALQPEIVEAYVSRNLIRRICYPWGGESNQKQQIDALDFLKIDSLEAYRSRHGGVIKMASKAYVGPLVALARMRHGDRAWLQASIVEIRVNVRHGGRPRQDALGHAPSGFGSRKCPPSVQTQFPLDMGVVGLERDKI